MTHRSDKSPVSRYKSLSIAALVLLVAGCQEPDVILVGEREPVRVNDLPTEQLAAGSRAIRLPSATNNASFSQNFGTEAYRPAHPALRSTPQRVWSVSIGTGDEKRKRITAAPVVADGRVFTLDSTARVTGFSTNGSVLWSSDLLPARASEKDATGGGLTYSGGALYVSLGFGDLVKLDAVSGNEIWRQRLGATGSGTPTVRDGLVYLVAGDDTGWAVNADDGTIAWQVDATPSVTNVLGAPAPALTSRLSIFAFGSGEVIATFRNGGLQRWTASVSGQRAGSSINTFSDLTGAPVVSGNTIYVGNQSGRIVALDIENGSRRWTLAQGTTGMIWPAGGSLFVVNDKNELLRVSASDGEIVWVSKLPLFVKDRPRRRSEIFAHYGPVVAGGRVIVVSNDGVMRSFSPENGALLGQVEIPDGASAAPAVAGGTLYVLSSKGELHAFR